jgi:solute carrier family 8 (sodium/calcium exchanger)
MALGSSAPEILLSVIETVTTLGKEPGELGPSTIVGSAAFNLLVISGLCIVGVGEEVKKIDQRGVFAITALSSMFAYIWLLIVLKFWTPDQVSLTEAVLTLIFFFMLVIAAFSADKISERMNQANMDKATIASRKAKQIKLAAKDEI